MPFVLRLRVVLSLHSRHSHRGHLSSLITSTPGILVAGFSSRSVLHSGPQYCPEAYNSGQGLLAYHSMPLQRRGFD